MQITSKDLLLADDIGIQIGPHAIGAAGVGNQFEDVKQSLPLVKPEQVIGAKQ